MTRYSFGSMSEMQILESQIHICQPDVRHSLYVCLKSPEMAHFFVSQDKIQKSSKGKHMIQLSESVSKTCKDQFSFKRVLKFFEKYSQDDEKYLVTKVKQMMGEGLPDVIKEFIKNNVSVEVKKFDKE